MQKFGDLELKAIDRVIKSKKFYRYKSDQPSECDLFENEFSKKFGCGNSLLVNSGTNAILLALKALDIKSGDEVLVPTYTFVATINAVLLTGAKPVLVKSNSELGMDLDHLTSLINKNTKAVLLVHMDGLSSNVRAVLSICKRHKLNLIEDVAQAMGGHHQNQALGTFGEFGCFSLNENKLLTCGEGGILITQNQDLYIKSHALHDTPSQFAPSRKNIFQKENLILGYSMRVSEIQGAIMRAQLTQLDEILATLKNIKNLFSQYLSNNMILGDCIDGDSSTCVHLRFKNYEHLKKFVGQDFNKSFVFYPITSRPAHHAFQWYTLINSYFNTEFYSPIDFIQERQSLNLILKLDLSVMIDMVEYEKLVQQIRYFYNSLENNSISEIFL